MDGRNSRIDRFLSSDRSKYEFASIRFVLRRAYLGSFVFNALVIVGLLITRSKKYRARFEGEIFLSTRLVREGRGERGEISTRFVAQTLIIIAVDLPRFLSILYFTQLSDTRANVRFPATFQAFHFHADIARPLSTAHVAKIAKSIVLDVLFFLSFPNDTTNILQSVFRANANE